MNTLTSLLGSFTPLFSGIRWVVTRKIFWVPLVATTVIVVLGEQYTKAPDSIKQPVSRYVGGPLKSVVLGITRLVSGAFGSMGFSNIPFYQANLEERLGTGQQDSWYNTAAQGANPRVLWGGDPRALCRHAQTLAPAQALPLYRAAAEKNHPEAIYHLAEVEANDEEKKRLYKSAYEKGSYPAGLAYAKLLDPANDERRAILVDVSEFAPEDGARAEAHYLLSTQNGASSRGMRSKRKHLTTASRLQHPPAYGPLAQMCEAGEGGREDKSTALRLHRLANGDAATIRRLETELGIPPTHVHLEAE